MVALGTCNVPEMRRRELIFVYEYVECSQYFAAELLPFFAVFSWRAVFSRKVQQLGWCVVDGVLFDIVFAEIVFTFFRYAATIHNQGRFRLVILSAV